MNSLSLNTPIVSVVIPNFNCKEYLPKMLNSILIQNISSLEIVVVDDGSTDGSREWLYSQSNTCRNIKVLKTQNVGPASARNIAIKKARGKYIAFLDSDDYWLPGKLLEQLAFMESHPNVAFSFTNYQQITSVGEEIGDGFSFWERFSKQRTDRTDYTLVKDPAFALYAENPVGTSTVVAQKQALLEAGLFDESLPSAEDIDLWLSLCRVGAVAYTNDIGSVYLVRPSSESSRFDDRMTALSLINKRFKHEARQANSRAAAIVSSRMSCAYAQHFRAQKAFKSAFKMHAKAFALAPTKQRFKAMLVDFYNAIAC